MAKVYVQNKHRSGSPAIALWSRFFFSSRRVVVLFCVIRVSNMVDTQGEDTKSTFPSNISSLIHLTTLFMCIVCMANTLVILIRGNFCPSPVPRLKQPQQIIPSTTALILAPRRRQIQLLPWRWWRASPAKVHIPKPVHDIIHPTTAHRRRGRRR